MDSARPDHPADPWPAPRVRGRVDAVVSGHELGLGLAEELEALDGVKDVSVLLNKGGQSTVTVLSDIHLDDAALAARMADAMLDQGVYVTAFSYPVVPKGQARIRVQLSAAHSAEDVEAAVAAFVAAREAVQG